MKIVCVSASNTKLMGDKSTSTKVGNLIKDIILRDNQQDIEVEVIPLLDYDIKTCILCGSCMKDNQCIFDEDFNQILLKLMASDGIFFVVPHYSPIPAKLIMIFEKLNEIIYSGWIHNPEYQSPLNNKQVGIIGHGGMAESEENLRYYHDHLITPVANILKSLSFHVVKNEDSYPNGTPFGLKDDSCIKEVENQVFPEIIQDWQAIEIRIRPLIENVLNQIGNDTKNN